MAGSKPYLTLNASVKNLSEQRKAVILDIEYNKIEFEFPGGFATLPLIEECRALNDLDDFDLMFDITMQLISGKSVYIYLKDDKGERHLFEKFHCTGRYMDLRGVPKINEYPIIVNWLVSFVGEHLRKKYPRLSESELQAMTSEKKA